MCWCEMKEKQSYTYGSSERMGDSLLPAVLEALTYKHQNIHGLTYSVLKSHVRHASKA